MELIIKIPDEDYKYICKIAKDLKGRAVLPTDWKAIANGTPYGENPKGEWIPMSPDCRGYSESFKCSICGAYIYPRCLEKELDYNGCPYCFADMRGD